MPTESEPNRLVDPPTMVGIVLTVMITLCLLNDISIHYRLDLMDPFVILALLLSVIPVGAYVVLAVITQSIQDPPQHDTPLQIAVRSWRWLVLPIATLLVITAILSGWPMHLRFLISKPALEPVVDQIANGEEISDSPQWIGAFWVENIMIENNGTIYFNTGRVLTDAVGVTYDPTNPKSSSSHVRLWNNWYGGSTY